MHNKDSLWRVSKSVIDRIRVLLILCIPILGECTEKCCTNTGVYHGLEESTPRVVNAYPNAAKKVTGSIPFLGQGATEKSCLQIDWERLAR